MIRKATTRDQNATAALTRPQRREAVFIGILLGIGIIGFIDEALFHQILQWHNFYWHTTQYGRILSDGLFHIFSTMILLWGTFRLWFNRLPKTDVTRYVLLAGLMMGAGGFQTYDGIVQHLILRLHLVNEQVCLPPEAARDTVLGICRNDLPYEVLWILFGLALLLGGVFWLRRLSRRYVR